MKLSDFIAAEGVIVPLAADTLSEASEALLGRIEASSAVRDVAKLRRRIDESRSEDLVVVGGRAFVLHYRAEAVGALRVAIGVSSEPIAREDARGRVVVLVVAPPREAARHLQLVRAFVRVLSQPDIVEHFTNAASARELAELDILAEFTLPEELTVRDLMTERPRTTTPEMPLRDAAREMLSAGLSALRSEEHTSELQSRF